MRYLPLVIKKRTLFAAFEIDIFVANATAGVLGAAPGGVRPLVSVERNEIAGLVVDFIQRFEVCPLAGREMIVAAAQRIVVGDG